MKRQKLLKKYLRKSKSTMLLYQLKLKVKRANKNKRELKNLKTLQNMQAQNIKSVKKLDSKLTQK